MRIFNNKSFKRFMLSYLLILFIPLTITFYFYRSSTSIVKQNAIDSNIFKLRNFRDVMDSRIERIDKNVMELGENEKFIRVAQSSDTSHNTADMYWFIDFYKYFKSFSFYGALDKNECFLFFNNNSAVYGSNYLNLSRQDF